MSILQVGWSIQMERPNPRIVGFYDVVYRTAIRGYTAFHGQDLTIWGWPSILAYSCCVTLTDGASRGSTRLIVKAPHRPLPTFEISAMLICSRICLDQKRKGWCKVTNSGVAFSANRRTVAISRSRDPDHAFRDVTCLQVARKAEKTGAPGLDIRVCRSASPEVLLSLRTIVNSLRHMKCIG